MHVYARVHPSVYIYIRNILYDHIYIYIYNLPLAPERQARGGPVGAVAPPGVEAHSSNRNHGEEAVYGANLGKQGEFKD